MNTKAEREKISKYLGKEVFILVKMEEGLLPEDIAFYGYKGDISFHPTIDSINAMLGFYEPKEDIVHIFHGVLTQASFIPEKINEKQYVILMDSEKPGEGRAHEVISAEDAPFLANEVENLMDADPFTDYDIEDMYILYGYGLNLEYSVETDTIDEEIIETCLKLVNSSKPIDKDALDLAFEVDND